MNLRPFVVVAVVTELVMVGLSIWAWGQVPADAQIPIHWNVNGQVNGYASKEVGLLLMPAISAGLAVLLYFLPRFEPRSQNLARSGMAYVTVVSTVLVVLALVQLTIVMAAVGHPVQITTILGLVVGLMFVVLGNVMGKVRSNYVFGVRTPWTLASDLSWNRTHRLVGRLFVLLGIACAIVGPVAGSWPFFAVLIGGIVVILVVAFVYSYRVWKSDPHKQPIGREPLA